MQGQELVMEIYGLLSTLPRFNCHTPAQELPENGIYFFFKDGNQLTSGMKIVLAALLGLGLIGQTVGSGSELYSTTAI